ncbi:Hypothetical protein GSB_154152 [Giardia duodenalis]|uniref:Uncharacterized protein n=1 Tax=Giardia intestinalis TaxID=5741 RepID=V6TS93_GIAIN|nr:Hypothetical protein GSB_154152 [Giardia intestinalis]
MPDRFAGLSEDDLHAMLHRHDLAANIPAECPQCIIPVYDQGHCDSRWALSAICANLSVSTLGSH